MFVQIQKGSRLPEKVCTIQKSFAPPRRCLSKQKRFASPRKCLRKPKRFALPRKYLRKTKWFVVHEECSRKPKRFALKVLLLPLSVAKLEKMLYNKKAVLRVFVHYSDFLISGVYFAPFRRFLSGRTIFKYTYVEYIFSMHLFSIGHGGERSTKSRILCLDP